MAFVPWIDPARGMREDKAYGHPKFIYVVSVELVAKWHFLTW